MFMADVRRGIDAMQLQDLSTFLTVAAERSFSSAAKKLHRTQPAVSQGIRRLEEELGERLFDRTSRTGTLTEAGPAAPGLRDAAACGSPRTPSRRCASCSRSAAAGW